MADHEGPRARYRQQIRDEVQTRAWAQVAEAGVAALSLKAIATQMGMTAPALYRYYASRDELLTQLILAAYEELATYIEGAVDIDREPADRIDDLARAFRRWATDHPQRYLLLYGTPVPGYRAPAEATLLAQRIFEPILDAFAASSSVPTADNADSPGFQGAIRFWTRLHGVLSLELAGHFVGMDVDPDLLYESETRALRADVPSSPSRD